MMKQGDAVEGLNEVAGQLRGLVESLGDDDLLTSAEALENLSVLIKDGDSRRWALFARFPVALALKRQEGRELTAGLAREIERAHSAGLQLARVFDHLDADEAARKYADARMAELGAR